MYSSVQDGDGCGIHELDAAGGVLLVGRAGAASTVRWTVAQ